MFHKRELLINLILIVCNVWGTDRCDFYHEISVWYVRCLLKGNNSSLIHVTIVTHTMGGLANSICVLCSYS